MKNSLFDSLFLVNLSVFLWDFHVFWKGTMYVYLYCENRGMEWLPDNVGFDPNLSLYCRKLVFFFFNVLGTFHACTGLSLRAYAEGFLGLLFQNKFICLLKVIFSILKFLKSI